MELGTIVRNRETGEVGVVAQDILSCCGPDQEPVVYDGSDAFLGTNRDELELIGTYDKRIDDPKRCGAGLGEYACIYASFEGGDTVCQRFSPLRNTLIFRTMTASARPAHLKPECQNDIMSAADKAGAFFLNG